MNTLEELDELLPLGVDRILLDNMDLDTMREAVGRIRELGAGKAHGGGFREHEAGAVRAVAETGVDFISVGALTHSAPSADLSLRVLDEGISV